MLVLSVRIVPQFVCMSPLFFFNDTATPEIYTLSDTLSLHDALPISLGNSIVGAYDTTKPCRQFFGVRSEEHTSELQSPLNISYAVFCLKKKNHDLAWVLDPRPKPSQSSKNSPISV